MFFFLAPDLYSIISSFFHFVMAFAKTQCSIKIVCAKNAFYMCLTGWREQYPYQSLFYTISYIFSSLLFFNSCFEKQ